jgi:hypothetical protein
MNKSSTVLTAATLALACLATVGRAHADDARSGQRAPARACLNETVDAPCTAQQRKRARLMQAKANLRAAAYGSHPAPVAEKQEDTQLAAVRSSRY